jgi:hypothetical protein
MFSHVKFIQKQSSLIRAGRTQDIANYLNPSSWFFANITEKSGLFAMLLLVISTSYLSWM